MVTPTKRTPEIEAEVLERMSKGETLTSICRSLGFTTMSWARWVADDDTLRIAHAHARSVGFDAIAEQCFDIADETARDNEFTETGVRPNAEWIQRSKLRVETRLKLLAKWDPKRYGERMDVNHSGSVDLSSRLAAARERAGEAPTKADCEAARTAAPEPNEILATLFEVDGNTPLRYKQG